MSQLFWNWGCIKKVFLCIKPVCLQHNTQSSAIHFLLHVKQICLLTESDRKEVSRGKTNMQQRQCPHVSQWFYRPPEQVWRARCGTQFLPGQWRKHWDTLPPERHIRGMFKQSDPGRDHFNAGAHQLTSCQHLVCQTEIKFPVTAGCTFLWLCGDLSVSPMLQKAAE